MLEKKQDKRYKITHTKIKRAVTVLIRSKSISDISITEIVKLAGISRNTFYLHFSSIFEVLDEITDEVIANCTTIFVKYSYNDLLIDCYPLVSELFSVYSNNKYLTDNVLFSPYGNNFIQKFSVSLTDTIYSSFISRYNNNYKIAYRISFVVSGILGVFYKWVIDGKPINIEEMIQNISEHIKFTIQKLI